MHMPARYQRPNAKVRRIVPIPAQHFIRFPIPLHLIIPDYSRKQPGLDILVAFALQQKKAKKNIATVSYACQETDRHP